MAKQTGIFKLQGTLAGLTLVESAAYDDHVRRARGTVKEAKVNEVLQGNADHAKPVNAFNSPLLRLFKTLDRGFAQGNLWSRMNGRMFRAKGMKVEKMLDALNGIEINERYPFERLFSKAPKFEFSKRKDRLVVGMELLSQPEFPKESKANMYLSELHVLFYEGRNEWSKHSLHTGWKSLKEGLEKQELKFKIPRGAKYFLVVVGVKGGADGKAVENFLGRGYVVCGWGKCSDRLARARRKRF